MTWDTKVGWMVPGTFRHYRIQHKNIPGNARSRVRMQTKLPSDDNTWRDVDTWIADHSNIEGDME